MAVFSTGPWFTQNPLDTVFFEQFLGAFRCAFAHSSYSQEAVQHLRQGSASAAEYSIDFRILERSMKAVYLSSLSDTLKDKLIVLEESKTPEDLIALSVRLDTRLRERRREGSARVSTPVRQPSTTSSHRSPFPPCRSSSDPQHSPFPGFPFRGLG